MQLQRWRRGSQVQGEHEGSGQARPFENLEALCRKDLEKEGLVRYVCGD